MTESTTTHDPWPDGVCEPDPDRPEMRERVALAVWNWTQLQGLKIAGPRLSPDEVSDIASDAIEAWYALTGDERLERKDPARFQPYMSGILAHMMWAKVRGNAKLVRLAAVEALNPDAVATPGAPQEREAAVEDAQILWDVMVSRLAPRRLEAILRTLEDGETYAEAAAGMQCAEKTVDSARAAGLRQWRRDFRTRWEDMQ